MQDSTRPFPYPLKKYTYCIKKMSRIPFSSDDADDIGSLTGNKITVSDSKVRLQVGTGDLEILDGKVECKSQLLIASSGIKFSDATVQTTAQLPPLPPYFMKAQLLSAYTGFTALNSTGTIPGMTELFGGGVNTYYGDWNTSTNAWDCPNTAFYNIRASVEVMSQDADKLRAALLKIKVSPVNGDADRTIGIGGLNMGDNPSSDGNEWFLHTSCIDLIQYQDAVSLEISWQVGSGTGIEVGIRATYIDIQLFKTVS